MLSGQILDYPHGDSCQPTNFQYYLFPCIKIGNLAVEIGAREIQIGQVNHKGRVREG